MPFEPYYGDPFCENCREGPGIHRVRVGLVVGDPEAEEWDNIPDNRMMCREGDFFRLCPACLSRIRTAHYIVMKEEALDGV